MRIIWSADAQNDVFDLAEYYDRFDPALADEIVERLETSAMPLIDFPSIGTPSPEGRRKWWVSQTPFLLLYRVVDDRVDIERVVHASSDWRD